VLRVAFGVHCSRILQVTFGGLTVSSQSIGVARSSSGFDGVDGILGVGPVDLTEGTVSGASTVPTFLDNLYRQGTISSEVLGVYFQPESGSDDDDANGELTLGGTDSSKCKRHCIHGVTFLKVLTFAAQTPARSLTRRL
jgi:hypothetical protein